MANVLEVLRDVANARSDYRAAPPAVRSEAAKRFARGIGCILATQLKDANGARTIWCQQYDALTLAPCAARNFEPTAACANESSRLLELLMSLPEPSPATIAAVDAGVTWLQHAALHNVAWDRSKRENTGLVEHPGAAPLWARFYDLETGAPIFGDRDRTIHYAVTEISTERRLGYNWYGTWPARALKLHTTWRTRVAAR